MAEVNASGPLFDGRADAAVQEFLGAATQAVAEEGYRDVQETLGQVLRHPTGYYQSRVRVESQRALARVHDSGVVYGPWLEGVGSRNRTTRFKGYATFRRVRQALDAKAKPIAESILPTYLRRMQ